MSETQFGLPKEELPAVFNMVNEAIYIFDGGLELIAVNKRAAEMYGFTREEFRQEGVEKARVSVPPYTQERAREKLERALNGGDLTFEWKAQTKDGETFWKEISLTRTTVNGDVRVLATARDISERKRKDQKLRERERKLTRFKRATEAAGHAIFLTEVDGEITYVNPAFEDVTGYSADEAIGSSPRILSSGEQSEEYYERLWETILDGRQWEGVIHNQRKSGEYYIAHQTITPVETDAGDIAEFVCIQNDITERIERTRQAKTLDRVLRHNLRNELNVIVGHVERLRSEVPEGLSSAVEEIDAAISELLETAGKGRGLSEFLDKRSSPTEVDLSAIGREVVVDVSERYPDAEVNIDAPESVETKAVEEIDVAIEEVAVNAIQHNNSENPVVSVEISTNGDVATLEISDNGPGISEIDQQVITGNDSIDAVSHGEGVGLWHVYWIVRRSGGMVDVQAGTGEGSTVTITLAQA